MQPQSKDLSQELHPLVFALAASIRSAWQSLPDLGPLIVADNLRVIHGQLNGETLFIGNELHQCRGLRKLHLEVARLGNGLQILHCVWFPDPHYDLPIFGADIVAGPAGISAAIVDLSPTSGQLPDDVVNGLESVTMPSFRQVRDLPGWGTIFSNKVCFIRPDGEDEEALFNLLVRDYLKVLSDCVRVAVPESRTSVSTISRYKGQLNYCLQQKRNDKTRRVLEKAFDSDWADRYIELLLFDNPPPL
ncbi:phycocyanobilin:ferredoxin oxidoreductase [Synechococcus sp. M16CYN]|uniref:phycocyanobilin:ferredoxin oxidoreductase n=1 Tax=Synechococcus sp. M16CYN TaxID=3103139 RepID=UPI003251043A